MNYNNETNTQLCFVGIVLNHDCSIKTAILADCIQRIFSRMKRKNTLKYVRIFQKNKIRMIRILEHCHQLTKKAY